MSYVRIVNNAVAEYPYSIQKLRSDNPNVSFSADPPLSLLAEWGVYKITTTPRPANTATENYLEGNPVGSGATWTQNWVAVAASPSEIAKRAEETAQASELSAAKLDAWVVQFLNMTPAQAQTFVQNNSASLAALTTHVARLAYTVRVLIRREFNR